MKSVFGKGMIVAAISTMALTQTCSAASKDWSLTKGGNKGRFNLESRSIFGKSTAQYKITHGKGVTKDSAGFVRNDGRYCVAVGSKYASKVGEEFSITMTNGKVFNCVVADQLADKDSDDTNSYCAANGAYIEFVVDWTKLNKTVKKMGNGAYNTNFCVKGSNGKWKKAKLDHFDYTLEEAEVQDLEQVGQGKPLTK